VWHGGEAHQKPDKRRQMKCKRGMHCVGHARRTSGELCVTTSTNLFKKNVLKLKVPCVDLLPVLKRLGLSLPPIAVRRTHHPLRKERIAQHPVSDNGCCSLEGCGQLPCEAVVH
jgi:hypothetical protein